jgi:hypothetical protein
MHHQQPSMHMQPHGLLLAYEHRSQSLVTRVHVAVEWRAALTLPPYVLFVSLCAAECCLEKVRFKLVFAKQRAKILYAPGNSQTDKDKVWGPYSYKFQIIVKVSRGHRGSLSPSARAAYTAPWLHVALQHGLYVSVSPNCQMSGFLGFGVPTAVPAWCSLHFNIRLHHDR